MMSCTYKPISTVRVNITPPARNMAAKVASRLRSRNRANGTTGLIAVRSTATKATMASSAASPEPSVVGASQPLSGPWVKPNTAAVQATVASRAPAASSFMRSRWVSRNVSWAR